MTDLKAGACLALCAMFAGCVAAPTGDDANAAQTVNDTASRYYDYTLQHAPETAYFSGVELDRHDGLFDNGPAARERTEKMEDELLAQLDNIDAAALLGRPEWITHAVLAQRLRADVAQRVCRQPLWNVNQMSGWHLGYTRVAQLQPVATASLRAQALARWHKLPAFIDQNIVNLRGGLEQGYSAPKTVVQRVVDQVDGLLALPVEASPFFSMATRDEEPEFVAATRALVAEEITPAIQRYRDFLANEYIDQARAQLSVTANPDGRECYEASLRAYTTIDRSGKEVYELGQRTVEANRARVIELGSKAYGLDDFAAIIAAAREDGTEQFETAEQLLAFSRAAVSRAAQAMPQWVGRMPPQPVEVVPFPPHEEGTGRSAHYRPGNEERPGEYRIPLHRPQSQLPGNAEATAFHETWPGHHLQVAMAQAVDGLHPVTRIVWFSGPGEGWARYSEGLAEEMGLYQTRTGPILRRAWPARGMVVDPGLHLFGWTREQAVEFMAEAGRFSPERAVEMVDRIAILPGQLTAYDSGGLEILALREQAEAALGDGFDIRDFHDRILENGTIPLPALRAHIKRWIDRPKVSSGRLDFFPSFASEHVRPRNVYVWLPPGYDGAIPYDVLYIHDGQNLFDGSITWNKQEWGIDEVAAGLQADNKVRDFIVVGIDNAGELRWPEYFPEKARDYVAGAGRGQHEFFSADLLADEYLAFLVTELKPFIDRRYAVNTGPESTFVMGSSMGGLISMYAVAEYPQVFGGAACISIHWPGIAPDDKLPVAAAIRDYMRAKLPDPGGTRIYFDHGTATLDAHYPPLQAKADAVMRERGYSERNWMTRSFEGAEHNEVAWNARLHVPLQFLFGTGP